MRIAVYQDYVHNNGSLLMALQDLDCDVTFVDAQDIIDGALETVNVLVMPGGADLYYCEKLNGAGNTKIKAFVENGGGYLGICAGAYYGCTQLNWDNGAISGSRELAFIDAVATGPLCDVNGSWYQAFDLQTQSGTFKTLYAAGPVFKNLNDDVQVLAFYEQGPAVIAKDVGLGRVILSSPHIEVSGDRFVNGRYTHNAKHEAHEGAVAASLLPDQETQRAFFAGIIEKLVRQ